MHVLTSQSAIERINLLIWVIKAPLDEYPPGLTEPRLH